MYSEACRLETADDQTGDGESDYLLAQAKAGAATLQLFDSWAGQALGKEDYIRYVQPYNTLLLQKIQAVVCPPSTSAQGRVPSCQRWRPAVGMWWGAAHAPRLVLGADWPRAVHPGQPGPGAAGPLAGVETPHRQCAGPGRRAARPHLQPGPRPASSPRHRWRVCSGWWITYTKAGKVADWVGLFSTRDAAQHRTCRCLIFTSNLK